MGLVPILLCIPLAALAGALPRHWRGFFILGLSFTVLYALQPISPIYGLDFWIPSLSLLLTLLTWAVTRPPGGSLWQAGARFWQSDAFTFLLLAGLLLLLGATRYAGPLCCLTPNRPPALWQIGSALLLAGGLCWWILRGKGWRRWLPAVLIGFTLALLVVLKTPALSQAASTALRTLTGQKVELASGVDLTWLGFSYLAFRLVHVLRDFQAGRLPSLSLLEFFNYALFFPSLTAGPIDRVQRWLKDSQSASPLSASEFFQASSRLVTGIFKKFVLADSLALVALNAQNAAQVQSSWWAWVLLYAYALRIFFDFSGYTDIAVGLGKLAGFRLPENFDRPYLRTNLTAFWNSWHMTLAQWFRSYVFNPLTRGLRTRRLPAWAIIFSVQTLTMLLIGLWHGVTLNFAIWGLWHGLGLFIHNRWNEWLRPRSQWLEERPALQRLLGFCSWLLTFHYVALGWIWFALPSTGLSLDFLRQLLGAGA